MFANRNPIARGLFGAFAAALMLTGAAHADEPRIKVTIVSVLASSKDTKIDSRLKELAPELKKKDPSWTGFEVERTSTASLRPGEKQTFKLVDDCELVVIVKKRDADGLVSLQINPPTLGDIEYTCCCEKYFPIITRYETKSQKHLVIAVMVQPCGKKK